MGLFWSRICRGPTEVRITIGAADDGKQEATYVRFLCSMLGQFECSDREPLSSYRGIDQAKLIGRHLKMTT